MEAVALKNLAAGYSLAAEMYPNRLTEMSKSTSLHIVNFQTDYKDTQIQFLFDESFPSRVPKAVVTSTTLSNNQKNQLCEELQKRGKSEEYTDTKLLPVLLEHAAQWLKTNYGKTTSSKTSVINDIREESWQLRPSVISDVTLSNASTTSINTTKQVERKTSGAPVRNNRYQVSWSNNSNTTSSSGSKKATPGSVSWSDNVPVSESARGDWLAPTNEWGTPITDTSDDWSQVPSKKTQHEKQSVGRKTNQTDKFTINTVPNISVKRDTRRANYFVAIRCTDDNIGANVEQVVKIMEQVDRRFRPICYNHNEVHVTLTTVALHSEEEIQAAVKALQDAAAIIRNHKPSCFLTIRGVDNFQDGRVVYGKVEVEEDVLLLRKVVRWAFQKAGIAPRDNYDYTPHMTLAKINVSFERKTGLDSIPMDTYEAVRSISFGQQPVHGIHLCQMGQQRREDGFYVCPTHIDF